MFIDIGVYPWLNYSGQYASCENT